MANKVGRLPLLFRDIIMEGKVSTEAQEEVRTFFSTNEDAATKIFSLHKVEEDDI